MCSNALEEVAKVARLVKQYLLIIVHLQRFQTHRFVLESTASQTLSSLCWWISRPAKRIFAGPWDLCKKMLFTKRCRLRYCHIQKQNFSILLPEDGLAVTNDLWEMWEMWFQKNRSILMWTLSSRNIQRWSESQDFLCTMDCKKYVIQYSVISESFETWMVSIRKPW